MAVTIIDKPFVFTPADQRLIVSVYDGANNGNAGFKYGIRIERSSNQIFSAQVPASPSGYGIFDLSAVFVDIVKSAIGAETTEYTPFDFIEAFTSEAGAIQYAKQYTVYVNSGWTINGEFVVDEANELNFSLYPWAAKFYTAQGYKPNPWQIYGMPPSPSNVFKALTDKKPNNRSAYNIPSIGPNDIVNVCSLDDYGVLSVIAPNSDAEINWTDGLGQHGYDFVRYQLYEGQFHSLVVNKNIDIIIEPDPRILHLPVFPKNIENQSSLASDNKPSGRPEWRYYSIQFGYTTEDPERPVMLSPKFWYYREDCEPRFDKVRLAWVNDHGGRDYFNFTKKNELTTEVDRKCVKTTLGNYNPVNGIFTMDTNYGETQELAVDASLTMELNSGWIDESDHQFLSSLIRSKMVHIVRSDATLIPVLIETNTWVHKKIRSSKLFRVSIKINFANGWQEF